MISTQTQIDYRTLPEALRVAGREKAVSLVKKGAKVSAVAEQFGTTTISVRNWVKLAKTGSLSIQKRGRKPGQKAKRKS